MDFHLKSVPGRRPNIKVIATAAGCRFTFDNKALFFAATPAIIQDRKVRVILK